MMFVHVERREEESTGVQGRKSDTKDFVGLMGG